MSGETLVTIIGNLTAAPELRFTQNGKAVANFTIASTPKTFDRQSNEWKDGEALFLRASVWEEHAEHIAASLDKGNRVIATGYLKQRSYETAEGEKRTSMELEIQEIGPALRYATVQVTRTQSNRNQAEHREQRQQPAAQQGQTYGRGEATAQVRQQEEPWAQPASQDVWNTPGQYADETPF
jgi:single-strand DNA-binding protein